MSSPIPFNSALPTTLSNASAPRAAHYLQPLLKTPFHERARALCQTDSFVPWSGYTTVDVFTNVEQEYFAIRNATTLYDLTPMVKYRVAGQAAQRYLNRLLTRDVAKLGIGRVAYCIWCDDQGHLIDDGTLFRLSETEYRLCTGERQLDWLMASAIGFDPEQLAIEELTEQIAALSMQGPTSYAVLQEAGVTGLEPLKPFALGTFHLDDAEITISRTGFTGDLGYELWMQPEAALKVWDGLMQAGRTRGIRAIGSRALNIARIEAGFVQLHADFVSSEHTLRSGTARSPFELGLGWLLDFDKPYFTGRRALLEQRRAGLARQLVGLDIEGTKPAHGALLYADQSGRRRVGNVTSATWSPTCKRNIALAMLERPHFEPGSCIWAEIYLNRELVWERRMVRARVVPRPFFAPARRTLTPPAHF